MRNYYLFSTLQAFLSAASTSSPGLPVGAAVNSLVYLFGIKVLLKGLTWEGVLSSWFLGTLSYAAFGPGSYSIVCLYFIVGSLVTKLKLQQKQQEGIAEARSGRRSTGSVLGSGFAGILCAVLALYTGNIELFRLGFVASFASKLADTTSSEVGKAYGKTTYLITSLKRVPRGTEGAVSVEGTVAGIIAAVGVAAVATALGQIDTLNGVGAVVVASVVANLLESVLGASVQGNVDWLTNDVVNGLQITFAALMAIVLKMYFGF